MEEAVSKALELTNEKETLIIVTGDHSHVFSMGGYNYRGNDILGNVFVVVNSILFVVCQCS
jgi:alkaline phosphatase